MNDIINNLEKTYMKKKIPIFRPGDTVKIGIWVTESSKKRLQFFEGIVISIRRKGLNSTLTIRKISNNEGVERTFLIHSPNIDQITVKRCGVVRKAKLYHLRGLVGKAARIKERLR